MKKFFLDLEIILIALSVIFGIIYIDINLIDISVLYVILICLPGISICLLQNRRIKYNIKSRYKFIFFMILLYTTAIVISTIVSIVNMRYIPLLLTLLTLIGLAVLIHIIRVIFKLK